MAVFISACDNSSEQEDIQNDNKDKVADKKTNSDDDAKNNKESDEQDNEDATGNTGTNDSELTEEEAKTKLIDYLKVNESELGDNIEAYDILMEEENGKYRANIYPAISTEDENKGVGRISSYEIDRKTGEVKRVEFD